MLEFLGYSNIDGLIDDTIPETIRLNRPLDLPEAVPEHILLEEIREIAGQNKIYRSYIGQGYYDTIVPGVILRNILENPGWYTQYTPYQAEISQGRLQALLNFQTMVMDLTGLEIANASLLDEGTAAAEAMSLFHGEFRGKKNTFLVSEMCHPQTISVVQTRAEPLGIEVVVGDHESFDLANEDVFGVVLQYPGTDGQVVDYADLVETVHDAGAYVVVAADLMSLALLKPPGEFGADAAVGNTQRFGVPMGYGGPHAAYMSCHEDFKRKIPGRIIGVSVDADGNPALRMALQTREQHIRREKATSNICTAQVLLAIMAGMYAVYHGPQGIRAIAQRIHNLTGILAEGLKRMGHQVVHPHFFDTIRVKPSGMTADEVMKAALDRKINLRDFGDGTIGIALDERVLPEDVDDLFAVFGSEGKVSARDLADEEVKVEFPGALVRTTDYLTHPVFNSYHSETEMLRYIHKLEARDLSLNTSMISLGSCTMKLNATTEMIPITWPEFTQIHPFAPVDQAQGYQRIISDLESWLEEISGFTATSMMPNSGANGEYTGLLVIRAYHLDHGNQHRTVCLVPASAHGTNPASAVMAGMKVVVVKTDEQGNIDVEDLKAKAEKHSENLAAIMVTYPSTHGVFESRIKEVTDIIHQHGGLVYLDGANLNAQVGLSRPGDYGADVCHFNLHKTFAIPHGGGGPGMGPISANDKLAPYLPTHPVVKVGGEKGTGPVSAGPWGSPSILPISWSYIRLLGRDGLKRASEGAILNANYLATRLEEHYEILYHGEKGRVAHEFILDLRPLRKTSGVTDEDVAKRLMDYGFHAPTQSFPVAGTLMVEPTESESKYELDRFCTAMATIRKEIAEVEKGVADPEDNVLHNAPHTSIMATAEEWTHPYSRSKAVFPASWTVESKFWPPVRRVDNAYGDRNLVCACLPTEAYEED